MSPHPAKAFINAIAYYSFLVHRPQGKSTEISTLKKLIQFSAKNAIIEQERAFLSVLHQLMRTRANLTKMDPAIFNNSGWRPGQLKRAVES